MPFHARCLTPCDVRNFICCHAGHRCHRALRHCGLSAAHAPPPASLSGAAAPCGMHGAWKLNWAAVSAGPALLRVFRRPGKPRRSPTPKSKRFRRVLPGSPASHATQRGAGAHGSSQGCSGAVHPAGHVSLGAASARRRGRVGCYVVPAVRARRHRWQAGVAADVRRGCCRHDGAGACRSATVSDARTQRGHHARTASSSTKSRNRPYSGTYASLTSPQDP